VANCLENKDESQLVKEDCTDPVEGEDGGNDSHENEPEPKPKVDFLINDILSQNTQTIVGLFISGRSHIWYVAWHLRWEHST